MRVPGFVTPNTLTVARIALTPLGVYVLFLDGGDNPKYQILAWTIFFILGVTDILDGRWARQANRVTALGAFLDPVADKVLIGSAMISLSIQNRFPWWITILILSREIGITVFRLMVIKGGVIPANKGGKLKTLMQSFGVGFFMLPFPEWLEWFRMVFISIAIILTVTTAYDYIRAWQKGSSRE